MFIHDGKKLDTEENILLERWKLKTLVGEELPEKPGYCIFNNIRYAIDLIKRHIDLNSRIVFHTDVDVDGVGTTYIMKRSFEYLGSTKHLLLINKEKVHGIQQKHVDYFNNVNQCVDLMIITDSSCNEIETIKQFNCDVLVIDHHKLLHNDLVGYCNDGIHRYVIINNTIDNSNIVEDINYLKQTGARAFDNIEEYKGTHAMSCGLVVYELMRVYCVCFNDEKLLENLMLYQWAGITLYTDVIDTLNERNQWYLYKTVYSNDVEKNIKLILNNTNKFKATLDKSYIQFSFAPLINKAIRAGKGNDVIDKVINKPYSIGELHKYDAEQKEALEKALFIKSEDPNTGLTVIKQRIFTSPFIELDITPLDIHANYAGVIASRLSGENHKNTVVYRIMPNGLCKGSFRGKFKTVDYREFFDNYDESIYAQGHNGAFGFELTKEQLDYLMNNISSIEPESEEKPFITAGDMNESNYGVYHVEDIEKFKRLGYLYKIAIGNSRVIGNDEIKIRVSSKNVKLKKNIGSVFVYDALGIECKAFEPMVGDMFDIYLEYTNELTAYIRKL